MNRTNVLPFLQKLAYDSSADTLLSAGRGNPETSRRTSTYPDLRETALFLRPNFAASSLWGPVRGGHLPGRYLDADISTPAQAPTLSRGKEGGGPYEHLGAITMQTLSLRLRALNPSVIHRAKAHRALAVAALRADSSLKTRVSRYNYHTEKARQLENVGSAK